MNQCDYEFLSYYTEVIYIFSNNLNKMEIHKKKINQIFKKSSKANIKNTDSGFYSPKISPYDTLSPKSIHKKVPLKSSSKPNCSMQRNTEGKKYTFNKTSYGTPHDKSAMISYISTPNQKSFNAEKLKKIRYTKRLTSKTKQIFQSTEEENLSDEIVLVHFCFGHKELTTKTYASFSSFFTLKQDFMKYISKIGSIRNNFFGFIGFETIPYNHGFSQILNDNQKTFKSLLQLNIRQISIQPQLTKAKPNYDKLNLLDFQILQYLGCGGFSTVYLAKCQADGNMCALKFIRKDSITSAKKVKMLENEKNILFSIDHPKLVDLYYAFETKNHIVFGLEYCPNGNLYNFLQKARTVSEEDAKYIIKQILQGLEYLHQNGILFRDIKLENILFDQHGFVKITDFGLSKPEIGQEDITYSYCGSPEYMAPEMLAKCGHSFQVDYYALGILLYELLYGRSPFYAPKKEDIFAAIINSEPRFPKTPMISKQAKSLIKGLLMKNPLHRIGSLKGVKEILSHPWLRGNSPVKTNTFKFNYENLKVSGSDKKKIHEQLSFDLTNQSYDKYFFPKSFVNKILVDELQKRTIAFERKQKKEKMLKVNSKQKSKK